MPKRAVARWAWAIAAAACLWCAAATAQLSTNAAGGDSGNPETRAAEAVRAPVRFRGSELFTVTAPIGNLSPAERAAAIEQRLLALAGGTAEVLDALRIAERDGLSEIYAGDQLVRAVTEQDAHGTGRTRRQLAADQLVVVRDALAVEFRDRSVSSLLRGALLALLATALLAGSLFLLRRFYRWAKRRITRAAQTWHWESGLARLSLLSPATVAGASRSLAAALAWLIGIVLLYAYLEFVLSLFPWTRGIADVMVATSRTAIVRVFSGLFGYLPDLLSIVIIVLVARFALKITKGVFEQVAAERIRMANFYPEWALPTYSLVRFLVLAVAAVMIFPYLPGSGSEGFRGVSVFLGLLVSLGAASAIANVIAGIVITYMRPFRVGDRVKIADAVGDVTGKDLFVVRLRTIKNVDITIPNSLVLANHIVNFSSSAQNRGLVLHTSVSIGYDVAWQTVHALLVDAASRVEGVKPDPAPFVLQTGLGDFYVTYELNAYTDRPNEMAAMYSQLHAAIQDSFSEAGVEIMSPHYTAVRDGNRMAVPDAHLPSDYQKPGFNVWTRILRPGTGS
jgi:small-conductance mechanosensitive channel